MIARFTRSFGDVRRPESLANWFRRRRFQLVRQLLEAVPKPCHIVDVGGTDDFWNQMGSPDSGEVELILVNLQAGPVSRANRRSVVGDARSLVQFGDQEFDLVFSNSVLEHVGSLEDQRRMAAEVRRIGKRYCVQTPHRYFPIEPHVLFPFFQFLPLATRVWLVRHLHLGWFTVPPDREAARRELGEIRLVTKNEMRALFPEATIYEERVLGLTKSFIAYAGWG
jgi:Methyltransferase domain